MQSLEAIVQYANNYLKVKDVGDWDNALNGLQLQNDGTVTKIGAAVDVSTRVMQEAVRREIDFLVVHHGLFWAGLQPVTGALHRQLKLAVENNIAVYSAHLPLDIHPVVGNNALWALQLGLKAPRPFFQEKGQPIGLKAHVSVARTQLVTRLEKSVRAPVKSFLFGPEKTGNVGIVTGGAGAEVYRMAEENIDTFVTGEAPHWAAVAAEELRMNLLLGGHYATETFGVKALAAHLAKKYRMQWEFLSFPTGI